MEIYELKIFFQFFCFNNNSVVSQENQSSIEINGFFIYNMSNTRFVLLNVWKLKFVLGGDSMNKLLTFLGIISLTTSFSASVLACSPKSTNKESDNTSLNQLITEFNAAVSKIVSDHIIEKAKRFNIETEATGIFSINGLEKYGKTVIDGVEKAPSTALGPAEIKKIVDKFILLLDTQTLEKEIENLAKGLNQFDILINNGVIVKDIGFDTSSIEINYTRSTEVTIDALFMADIKTKLLVSYQYIGFKNELIGKTLSSNLSLVLTNNSGVKEELDQVYTDLENAYLLGNELSWWTDKTLNYAVADRSKIFEMYNDNIRIGKLNTYYKDKNFETLLNNSIQVEGEWLTNTKFLLENVEILNEQIDAKVGADTREVRTYEKGASGVDSLHKPLFSKFEENDSEISFVNSGKQKIIKKSTTY
ncbi:hypothetical protein SCLARK_001876 [Spiroplasma clarkii]|nr:hypothetical protein SCLARK_001876 [Spiroplasma clarkii]